MRKIILSTLAGLVLLTGQAMAKQTGAVATRVGDRVGVAGNQQLAGVGLGIIPILLVGAGVIAIIAGSNDNKYKVCVSSSC